MSASVLRVLARRGIHTTPRLAQYATASIPLPARQPIGAFRGGLFGFLAGSSFAGAAIYGYLVKEYRASNDLLTEDIYNLHAAVQRVSSYVESLEDRMEILEKRASRRGK